MDRFTICDEIPKEAREELGEYSDIVAHLLFYRDIKTKKEAETFFNHNYQTSLHNPFLLKDIEKACHRIESAIDNNEKICIYADYDADGIPAAAVLSEFFNKVHFENFFVYIPHRNKEGFGLNKKAIDQIKDRETDLIITVDCGIADVEEVEYINELGMEVVITDHHEVNGRGPKAFAIINPKQNECQYPEKMLCGSGVAFKLVQALVNRNKFSIQSGWEKTLLDLVGIATLSDMVPLKGENRALASFGLTMLRMSPRKGLHKLFTKTRLNQKSITEDDVGFTIAPRINAASRMDEPETALNLLLTKDYAEADAVVSHLHKMNDERKGHVAAIVKEVKKAMKDKNEIKIIVHGNAKWQPSLLGLAASNLSEEYSCPVFLWGRGDGSDLKGSCRSPESHSIIDLLNGLPEGVLITYGGHHQAGGFVVHFEQVDFLFEKLLEVYNKLPTAKDLSFNIDYILNIEEVNEGLWQSIQRLAPFGIENPKPVFLFKNVVIDDIRNFGKRKEHFGAKFSNEGRTIDGIAFYKDRDCWYKNVSVGDVVDVIASIEKDTFSRFTNFRLRIVDIV
ncbi:single-stranded-DNA-specific exonuclease RecJ [Candidatus Nomurabacteria bacterium]|nr:single-stranded-DNA-specific exonuclease RecJ [Candidatus Nomurabacteria bacterium]